MLEMYIMEQDSGIEKEIIPFIPTQDKGKLTSLKSNTSSLASTSKNYQY